MLPALWGRGCPFTCAKTLWSEQTSFIWATERRVTWGGRHGAGVGNRPQTLRSCKALWGMVRSVVSWSWWGNFQEFCELVDAMLAAWYQSWWEYLYHRSQQMLQIRATAFPRELFVKLLQLPAGLCPKTTRNRLILEGQCFCSSWVVLGQGVGRFLDLHGFPVMSSFYWKEKTFHWFFPPLEPELALHLLARLLQFLLHHHRGACFSSMWLPPSSWISNKEYQISCFSSLQNIDKA